MPNSWLLHVQEFRSKHPEMKYKEALSKAKATYKTAEPVKAVAKPVEPPQVEPPKKKGKKKDVQLVNQSQM